jgi:hypothetical protein
MHRDNPLPALPAAWGTTIVVDIPAYEPTDAWRDALPDWSDLVVRNPDEDRLHHGSNGSLPVDTIAIAVDGVIAALADSRHITMENQYAYDQEYFQYLRLRDVLDAAAWARLPWAALSRGHVFLAWDKFHGCDYVRTVQPPAAAAAAATAAAAAAAAATADTVAEDETMTFGGSWSLLEDEINARHFPDEPAPLPVGPPTDADLLSAVRGDRLDRVRALLEHGRDPNAAAQVPPHSGLDLGVSHARDSSLLWESVHHASPAVTAALLDAGAAVDARPPGGLTALLGAILNDHTDHVPVLLAHGADPDATHNGKTALEIAESRAPELARLMRAIHAP